MLSFFKAQNFACIRENSIKKVLFWLEKESIDLVLISNYSKYKNIFEEIRSSSSVPIVLIFNNRKKSDLIKTLREGADVCLFEPINKEELLARVTAILRRSRKKNQSTIRFNGLIWREDSYDLKFFHQPISLAPKEFTILGFLLKNPDKVITHGEMVTTIWGKRTAVSERTVHSYIRNIRHKLKEAGFPIDLHLITIWGVGYRWDTHGLNSENIEVSFSATEK